MFNKTFSKETGRRYFHNTRSSGRMESCIFPPTLQTLYAVIFIKSNRDRVENWHCSNEKGKEGVTERGERQIYGLMVRIFS